MAEPMADVQAGDELWPCQMRDMIGLTNEDLLDGWDRPTGAGSAISLVKRASIQAVHLMKEEKWRM